MCNKVTIGRVGYRPLGVFAFRCDRNSGSPLGNPYKINKDINREDACKLFSEYFKVEMGKRTSKVKSAIRLLYRRLCVQDVYLQCHCSPDLCHCETIREYLYERVKRESLSEDYKEEL